MSVSTCPIITLMNISKEKALTINKWFGFNTYLTNILDILSQSAVYLWSAEQQQSP